MAPNRVEPILVETRLQVFPASARPTCKRLFWLRWWSGFSAFRASSASVGPGHAQGRRLSGCLSGNPVVEGVLLHVVRPGGGRHAAVRVQKDPEAAHDQQAQEDEEDEDEDEGRALLQSQEVGGRRRRRRREVGLGGGKRGAVQVIGHDGTQTIGQFRGGPSAVQSEQSIVF